VKSRQIQTGPSPLPSREEVAAFIASAPGKVGKREIARAFNLGSADRIWLKDTLRELEDQGTLARRGKRPARERRDAIRSRRRDHRT
jgi:ribonuclease R